MLPIKMMLLTVLVLLTALPTFAASPYSGNSSRAVQWLSQNQNSDGSWGASDNVKLPYTAEAVMALKALNQRTSAYYAGVTWLENHNAPNIDYEARRILALSQHGDNVQPDLAYLQAAQKLILPGNSGWGLSTDYQGSPLDSAVALLACSQLGITSNVQAALNYLKGAQLTGTDKGWPVAQETAGDAVTTAFVVQAMAANKSLDSTLTTPIANGVSTLVANVGSASPVHIQALTALTHLRAGYAANSTPLLNTITGLQSADGSWSEDPYTTAIAARAFAASMGSDLTSLAATVYMPDPNLRAAVNIALGKNSMDNLTKGDLANLSTLNVRDQGITNLTGLEWATNLTSIDLRGNSVSSLAPINGLTNLSQVLTDMPVAAFTASPATVLASVSENFTDQSLEASSWLWTFGDIATSTIQNPVHTYTYPGTYAVTLKVTNSSGTNSITKNIVVGFRPGDCNGDNRVSSGEFTNAINVFMGRAAGGACISFYINTNVTAGYFTKALNGFMGR